jgi:cyclophilin family peptidyl-prolyl cis-trans isomerase
LAPAAAGFSSIQPAVLTGLVYLNPTDTGVFQSGDTLIPGANVSLTGTTLDGAAVNTTATTDANGKFTFFQVLPGTYTLSEQGTGNFVGGKASIGNLGGTPGANAVDLVSVTAGEAGLDYNLSVRGLGPGLVSLRQFLATSSKTLDTSLLAPAGSGTAAVDNTVQPSTAAAAGTASLAGSVLDPKSAGISGVQIALTGTDDTGRDINQTATTDSNGAYQFSGLQPGTYTLNVTSQPAGFRAGSPSVGSLGGIVLRNHQIIGISVTTGASGTGYKFNEISLPAPGSGTTPVITAGLADDTAGPGGTASDGITSDPSVGGSVTNPSTIVSFKAGLDSTAAGSFTDVLANLSSTGSFFLNAAFMGKIAGGKLADGAHTLHLSATNAQGTGTFDVTFTLQTVTPTIPTLHLDSTSDPTQSGRTTASTVTVQGQTSPGVQVDLIQGNNSPLTKTADTSGNFSFSNIALTTGSNTFIVRATDSADNISQFKTFFVRESAPVAVPTAPVVESIGEKGSDQFVDLSSPSIFTNPDASPSLVQFNTTAGPMDVQLFDSQTPQTVANFLSYVTGGKYTNDVFHRLDTNPPVLQGGGFTFNTTTKNIDTLTPGPDVPNEFSKTNPNVAGTIAMAKQGGNQNSANSQFFFNLGDNSTTLNASNNGGFTVFGKVASGADQRVLNTLAAFPVVDETATNSAFNVFPLKNFTGTFPTDANLANFAAITGITVLQQPDKLTFSVVSNSNTNIVTATITQGQLDLHPTGNGTGTATIVVKATNEGGQSANVTFTVNVGAINFPNPGNQTDLAGDTVNLPLNATSAASSSLTFSNVTGLPSGLGFTPQGIISGTIDSGAAKSTPYTVTATVTDGTNTVNQTFEWTVLSA